MKWYLLGTNDPYYFWFRNPDEFENGLVYQVTNGKSPVGEAGYYNLKSLMKKKGVKTIAPSEKS